MSPNLPQTFIKQTALYPISKSVIKVNMSPGRLIIFECKPQNSSGNIHKANKRLISTHILLHFFVIRVIYGLC